MKITSTPRSLRLALCLYINCFLVRTAQSQTFSVYTDTISVPKYDRNGNITGSDKVNCTLEVPPGVTQIRGIYFSGTKDADVRAALTEQQIALVTFNPNPFSSFDTTKGHDVYLLEALARLAQVSNMPEVAHAPWMPFGVSAGSVWTYGLAYWNPERVFAAIGAKTGGISKPKWLKRDASMEQVPFLTISGQYEEYGPNGGLNGASRQTQWWSIRDTMMKHRPEHYLMSMLVEPNGTHTSWYILNNQYIANFIRKAAQARIPTGIYATTQPIKLKTIDETQGWLSDTAIYELIEKYELPKKIIDAYNYYEPTKRSLAFWHFDQEMATQWVNYHHSFKWDNVYVHTSLSPTLYQHQLQVFSNPATAQLIVHDDIVSNSNSILQIYNMLGQAVPVVPYKHGDRLVIDLGNFPQGTYTLIFSNGQVMKRALFVKQ